MTDTPATGPWANLVQEAFTDPDQQVAVDAFLREHVQPYVTQKEQAASLAESAQALYDDFQSDAGQAWVNVTAELFGEDSANELLTYLKDNNPETPATEETTVTDDTAALTPEQQSAIEWANTQRQQGEYSKALDGLVEKYPDINRDLIAPFITAADGDLEVAAQGYKQWIAAAQTEGVVPPVVVPEVVVEPGAPPVIGGDHGTPPAPPVQQKYDSIDSALDDFFNEQNASPPPVVGAT